MPPPVGAIGSRSNGYPAALPLGPSVVAGTSTREDAVQPRGRVPSRPVRPALGLAQPTGGASPRPKVATVIGRAVDAKLVERDVVLDNSGRLGLGEPPVDERAELAAWTHWVCSNTEAVTLNTLPSADLSAVSARLVVLLEIAANPARGAGSEAMIQARACLLHALRMVIARTLGDEQARALSVYHQRVKSEPVLALRQMAARALPVELADADLLNIGFRSAPPYEAMLKDGVISIDFKVDDDGCPWADAVSLCIRLTDKQTPQKDGSIVFSSPAEGSKPALRIHLSRPPKASKNNPDPRPNTFAKINDPKTDLVVYSGHAGYGYSVRQALDEGARGSGAGKLVVLLQCNGMNNLNDVALAFPQAQVVSTLAPSINSDDARCFASLIEGLRGKQDWRSIHGDLEAAMHTAHGERYKLDDHYFFPTSRVAMLASLDVDEDGVLESEDNLYTVSKSIPTEPSFGLMAQTHEVAPWALRGAEVNNALADLGSVFRYDKALTDAEAKQVGWSSSALSFDGFFSPKPNETAVFRFADDGAGGVRVMLNVRYAHATSLRLSRMLAIEWAERAASILKWDDVDRSALTLFLWARLDCVGLSFRSSLLGSRSVLEPLVAKAYGWPMSTSEQVDLALGVVEETKPEHFQRFRAAFRERPSRLGTRIVASVATPVPGPGAASAPLLPEHSERIAAFLKLARVPGELIELAWSNDGVVAATLVDGVRQFFAVSVDREGRYTAAARLDIEPLIDARMTLQALAADWGDVAPALSTAPADYLVNHARFGRAYATHALIAAMREAHVRSQGLMDATRAGLSRLLTAKELARAFGG